MYTIDKQHPALPGYSLLHYAAEGGSVAITRAVLQAMDRAPHADAHPPRTPLHVACLQGHAALVPLLLQHGSMQAADRAADGATALHYAARGMVDPSAGAACLRCARAVQEAGCPVDTPDAVGCCPVHYAAGAGCLAAVDALIEVRL